MLTPQVRPLFPWPRAWFFAGAALLGIAAHNVAAESANPANLEQTARQHYLRGRYAEAADAYQRLAATRPAEAALGLSRALFGQGRIAQGVQILQGAIDSFPIEAPAVEVQKIHRDASDQRPSRSLAVDLLADLHAELAWRQFESGDYVAADAASAAALARSPDHLLARWVQAERLRVQGKLDEADQAYAWFVPFYNQKQLRITRAEDIRWIALAAAQSARWQNRPGDFRFIVNRLLPKALELEADYWPAHYEAGRLFSEKYNQAEASRSFAAALQINPQSAETHAAVAALALQHYDLDGASRSLIRALEIHPRLTQAHALWADWHIANFDRDAALARLHKAVDCNPADESVLGRLLAFRLMEAGEPTEEPDYARRLDTPGAIMAATAAQLIAAVETRNAAPGEFYFAAAVQLDDARRFDLAERYYQLAAKKMPRLAGPQSALGLMLMRLGREDEARQALEASFASDPFHVRVANTLQVLDVLDTYQKLETEHFIFRYDARDALLARSAARYLERDVYPQLCRQFGFEPPGKTLIEIFHHAKNTPGHGWFSARMVGLPYLGTVGACAGRVVGMVSPDAMPSPFHWARVLKHEFVHILNLQQTAFHVPHWFTEALAVMNEGDPRPEGWNRLLARRYRAGTHFKLDEINLGFIRPHTSDDWTLAYCQAEIYAEYMLHRFGKDAIARLLAGFADQPDTATAIYRAFAIDQADFERGYEAFLEDLVAKIQLAPETSSEQSFVELERALQSEPENAQRLAEMAAVQFAREQFAEARKFAEAAIAAAARQAKTRPPAERTAVARVPLASYVLARTRLLIGDDDEALQLLEQALDDAAPHPEVLSLLAQLRQRGNDPAGAEKLYVLARRNWPHEARWSKALAALYLAQQEEAKLAEPLEHLAGLEVDNAVIRKKLAQLALKRRDFAQAVRWAESTLHIDVNDAQMQRFAAVAYTFAGRHEDAAFAYAAAVELKPTEPAWQLEWAKSLRRAGQYEQARRVLVKLLERDPQYPGAKELLDLGSSEP